MNKYTLAVSTLNDGINNYKIPKIKDINKISFLIIHQISKEYDNTNYEPAYSNLKSELPSVKIITSYDLGLSKSRNIAILSSTTPYILFSDDDNSYDCNLVDILEKTTSNQQLQIYSFKIRSEDGEPFKVYPKVRMKHNKKTILRLSSIENLYDLNFIKNNNIFFNENFGLGAKYPSCEQPIFANNILSKNGKGYFFPINLAIHPKENSGDNYYQPLQAKARRKMFLNIYGYKGWLFTLFFYIKKFRFIPLKNQLSFFHGLFIK
ncbi:glycosyltransferase family 2 protein [Providencia huaxiensis]|uniref:glycosyltransferase family 2 protein n=1 Tax=Providencia huaxiensis TaxID=2027290 RepID=UPI001B393963|nr:hypothetical protein [Providencia huaxiensis]MBQ0534136.1 hypothetical protein [Providencia huaxiensis]MBQ0587582.1 hypothetical protein [Providencia huaxiensis]MCG9537515.1 hypothetical protein [Providencia huaxiensis]